MKIENMEKETAQTIANYAGRVREDYSGRGMYGETTTAIICDSDAEFRNALSDAIDEADDAPEKKQLMDLFRNYKSDQLGKSMIFY